MGKPGALIPGTALCITDNGAEGLLGVRRCVKIFELDTHFSRLRIGNEKLGQPVTFGSLNWTGGTDRISLRPGNFSKEKSIMRSDLVFGALSHVSNRYQLCQLASKATRKLHKPNTRLQDTTNEVLGRFQTTNPGRTAAPVEAAAVEPQERRRAA
jgi:hypothetical protein